MSEVTITEARGKLSALVDAAHREPVYLTRRDQAVAAIVDSEQLQRLLESAEELADIRAVDEAWDESERLAEVPVPWDEVKRELGLA
jgi:prevent-host-death family protein